MYVKSRFNLNDRLPKDKREVLATSKQEKNKEMVEQDLEKCNKEEEKEEDDENCESFAEDGLSLGHNHRPFPWEQIFI